MLLALLGRLGLAGYVVECDSMPRKESREKECGLVVGMMAPLWRGSDDLGSVESLRVRSGRNWTTGAVSAGQS